MDNSMRHCIVLTIALSIVIFFHRFGKEHAFPTASKLSWSFSPIAIFLSTNEYTICSVWQ